MVDISDVKVVKSAVKNPQFKSIVAKQYIHLPPSFVGNESQGIEEQLNRFLMRYIPEVDGVVLAYSDIKYLEPTGKIFYDSPFFHFHIRVRFTVYSPDLNSNVVGVVNKVSPDHIGLLVHGVFNASIPADNIRRGEFTWDEDTAGWRRTTGDDDVVVKPGSILRFTVVDLMKANEMLTLTGSLLVDTSTTGVLIASHLPPPPLPALHVQDSLDGADMEGIEVNGAMEGIEVNGAMEEPAGLSALEDVPSLPDSPVPRPPSTPSSVKRKRTQEDEDEAEVAKDEVATPIAEESSSKRKPKTKKQKVETSEPVEEVKTEPGSSQASDSPKKEKSKQRQTRGLRKGRSGEPDEGVSEATPQKDRKKEKRKSAVKAELEVKLESS
ncbi:hypothetical protein BC832DRAFT_549276 [Gaertneriomyces semiglobifer]|nr:hypothetical protein BC832DRAFT_549276 [Gaertneriomyces semiglobifer]